MKEDQAKDAMNNSSDFAQVLTVFVMIANPIGAIHTYVSLTEARSTTDRHHTALVTDVSAAIVLLLNAALRESLLKGTSINCLRHTPMSIRGRPNTGPQSKLACLIDD